MERTPLLVRMFIKDCDDTANSFVRKQHGVLSGCVGIVLNLLLSGGKLLAGLLTGSVAIIADATNNLSDAGSSVVTLIGFKMAGKHSLAQRPFGYGRYEYVAGLVVSLIILLVGAELIKTSIDKIINPQPVQFRWLAMGILGVSIVAKLWMCLFNRTLGRRIDSAALQATARDSLNDVIATTAVVGGMAFTAMTGIVIDGYLGLFVAGFVIYGGISSGRETLALLIGKAPSPELVQAITELVLKQPGVVGMHDLVVHDYGPGACMISLHAEVPADGDMLYLHDSIDSLEMRLQDAFHCNATIHMDPVAVHDEVVDACCREVQQIVVDIDERLTIHDFRVVQGPTHTNLIFDVVLPHTFAMADDEVVQRIQTEITRRDPTMFAVARVDHSFTGQ